MYASELLEPFERLLSQVAPLARLREIERGAPVTDVWQELASSGFMDALVAEQRGGSGLSFADAGALIGAAARHLVPLPFADTLIARALLAASGVEQPDGPIVLVTPALVGTRYSQRAVPLAAVATHALADLGDRLALIALAEATVSSTHVHGSQAVNLEWDTALRATATISVPTGGLRSIVAILRAIEIAGAAEEILQMTVAYAGDRVQFGKPIGRQQAVQQQLAVMAESVLMARMAAQMACARGFPPLPGMAAIAKHVTSAAVPTIVSIAHAVHGAIGISEEYDLQLFTRRLHEWRIAEGSEAFWGARLGAQRVSSAAVESVEFVRLALRSA